MNRTSLLILGPPKTGKSTFASSIAALPDVNKVLMLTMRPKEADSFGYQVHSNIEVRVISDPGWLPGHVSNDRLSSRAFRDISDQIIKLYDDDTYDAVIIDPLTDIFIAAGRGILAKYQVTDIDGIPGKGSMQYFGELGRDTRFFIQRLTMLTTAKHPKWVIATQHTKPITEEDLQKKKHSDARARGVRFEGDVLPQMEGSYRYDLGGEFSIQLFTHVSKHYKDGVSYQIQVGADRERHAAVGSAPKLSVDLLPNNMTELVKAVDDALANYKAT